MFLTATEIHERAVRCAKQLKRCEAEMIVCFQLVQRACVYLKYEQPSLHLYAVNVLGLSEDQAYHFKRVALKALEIPEILAAVRGGVSVSKIRRVMSVITPGNQAIWIQRVKTLSQARLEREVARANPKELVKDKLKPLTGELYEVHCSVPVRVRELIERVQDLESKRLRRGADLAQVLEVSLEVYLEKNDPLRRARRAEERAKKVGGAGVGAGLDGGEGVSTHEVGKSISRHEVWKSVSRETSGEFSPRQSAEIVVSRQGGGKSVSGQGSGDSISRQVMDIEKGYSQRSGSDEKEQKGLNGGSVSRQTWVGAAPRRRSKPVARVIHKVALRDDMQCVFRDEKGVRCLSRRFTERHHVMLRAYGGSDTVGNLVTLCSSHHGYLHRRGAWSDRVRFGDHKNHL
ncbi:MAG: HNH endonuclease [Deltaproteobacteria bacterium]|nr:HNH endonuclease [Deltaproteobacteria bacterium]MBI3294075.1 HNH endonuclease [Deltaproteobacteria bacterium]